MIKAHVSLPIGQDNFLSTSGTTLNISEVSDSVVGNYLYHTCTKRDHQSWFRAEIFTIMYKLCFNIKVKLLRLVLEYDCFFKFIYLSFRVILWFQCWEGIVVRKTINNSSFISFGECFCNTFALFHVGNSISKRLKLKQSMSYFRKQNYDQFFSGWEFISNSY